eukprot:m.163831 g.163831  ORF g.163831 m.163831 type:complete len:339 (+) comp12344_c0_seq1:72-1088(+)
MHVCVNHPLHSALCSVCLCKPSHAHQRPQTFEILDGLGRIWKRVRRPNGVRCDNSRQQRHVVAVAWRRPIGAVVDTVTALGQSERQHCHNVPARVERVCPCVVPRAHNLARVNRLAFRKRVRNEKGRSLVGRDVLQPLDAWTLYTKVVRVFNVQLAVTVTANLDIVGAVGQDIGAMLLRHKISIVVHNGVHVTRSRMPVVGILWHRKHRVFNPVVALVDVLNCRALAGKHNLVDDNRFVILIRHRLGAIGVDTHVQHPRVGMHGRLGRHLGKHLANARAGVRPRLARGEDTVIGVFRRWVKWDVDFNQRARHCTHVVELVREKRRRIVGGKHNVPPLL